MRIDAIDWDQTYDHLSIHTSPRTRLPRLVTHLVLMVIAYQACISAIIAIVLMNAVEILDYADATGMTPPAFIQRFLLAFAHGNLSPLLIGVLVGGGAVITTFTALLAVRIRIRHWSRGLSDLHVALQRLGNGHDPLPLTACGEDEIAYLSILFNRMAAQITESRQSLIEANELLERRVIRRTAELQQTARQLDEIAHRDQLTGLANRRAMMKAFDDPPGNGMLSSNLVCLAFDLDGFKGVNDSLGHEAGDRLLCLAAEVIRRACRSQDLAVRLGGDEFILMLSLPEPEDAYQIATRLIDQFNIESRKAIRVDRLQTPPSMSVGIATMAASGATSIDDLVRFADEALYEAKRAGKSRFATFTANQPAALDRAA